MVNDNSELCGLAGQAVTERNRTQERKRAFWLMIPDTVKVPLSALLFRCSFPFIYLYFTLGPPI